MQPGSLPAGLVAELETASRLVHQQSLQQTQLLEGLEHALAELSEHRLLIQNRQAAPSMAQQTAADGTMRLQISCDMCNRKLSLVAGRFGRHFDLREDMSLVDAQTSKSSSAACVCLLASC